MVNQNVSKMLQTSQILCPGLQFLLSNRNNKQESQSQLIIISKVSNTLYTAQKMKFSTKDFFIKCDQIRSFLRIWSDLLEKSLIENFIFCAVL